MCVCFGLKWKVQQAIIICFALVDAIVKESFSSYQPWSTCTNQSLCNAVNAFFSCCDSFEPLSPLCLFPCHLFAWLLIFIFCFPVHGAQFIWSYERTGTVQLCSEPFYQGEIISFTTGKFTVSIDETGEYVVYVQQCQWLSLWDLHCHEW